MGAERFQRPGKEAAGSRHEPGVARQAVTAAAEPIGPPSATLLEEVRRREHLRAALKRVQANQGAPGVDGMTVDALAGALRKAWPAIREQLLQGPDAPAPVREVQLPKPGGGTRMRGIPPVLDRFITQAMLPVMSPRVDPGFSDHSDGFRPGRRAHQAVEQACHSVAEGYRWVVAIDLEKFFDHVKHDMLMSRVARHIKDTRLLKRLRRYLTAGILPEGLVSQREAGTPQGAPRAPRLSHSLLDSVDKELERRGHRCCREAEDAHVYVRSQRAGERGLASRTHVLEGKLRLTAARSATEARPAVYPAGQRAATSDHTPGAGTKPPPGHPGDSPVYPRRDRLRSARYGTTRRRGPGSMAAPPAPEHPLGAMAQTHDP